MIKTEDLLKPVSEDNETGNNLKYDPIFDEIKKEIEISKKESLAGLNQGAWQEEVEYADWNKVEKLAGEALIKRSKDLQLAEWLLESQLKLYGYKGFAKGLELIYGLCTKFWEKLYPEIEDDGDLDYRMAPVSIINHKNMFIKLREAPVTGGDEFFSLLDYEEAKRLETETKNNPSTYKES